MSPIGSSFEKKIKKIYWSLALSRGKFPGPSRSGPVQSLLALRPDRLGDFILSAPALRELEKQIAAGGRLTLVAGERNEKLARYFFPDAKVLVFRKNLFQRLGLFLRLWFGSFDLAVDFHSYPFSTTSGLLALLSGSGRRVGFWDGGESAAESRSVFNEGVPPPLENLRENEKSLRLVRRCFPQSAFQTGFLRLPPVPEEIRARAELFISSLPLKPGDRLVGIHPTLLKKDNRWSLENYAELIGRGSRRSRVKWAVIYGQGEEGELRRFQKLAGSHPSVFSLPENDILFILECLKRTRLFVGGDSGLTHLASLATKVIAVFGPSDPRRWGPMENGFGRPKVLRKKDGNCDSVTVKEVEREIGKILAANKK